MKTDQIVVVLAAIAILAAAVAGCSSNSNQQPQATATPHFVTDLSSLSPAPISPLVDPSAAFAATHDNRDQDARASEGMTGDYISVGTDRSPGILTLTNPKAAEFKTFSFVLLSHLFAAVRDREQSDEITRLKLPSNLRSAIITATLDKDGKLKEIVVEQHSGKGAIDQLLVSAAKQSLWAPNPPKEAAETTGNYQLRINFKMENFASVDGRWVFKTYIGLALL